MNYKHFGLVGFGLLAGFSAALQLPAAAQKTAPATAPLPLTELRQLSDVYGLIRTDYV